MASSKRLSFLAFVSLILAASAVLGQGPAPKAVIPDNLVDFGVLAEGDKLTRTVTIENRGDAPLHILRAISTCACNSIDFPEEVAPNGKGELTIRLDSLRIAGAQTAKIRLFTDDPTAPRMEVNINMDVRPYLWAQPAEVRYIVYQKFEEDSLVKLLVMATAPEEFRITGLKSPFPYLDVSYRDAKPEERDPDHKGPQYVIESRLSPDAPVGALVGYIEVMTEHAKQSRLAVPVSGFVRPIMHVTPPRAELGDVVFEDGKPYRWSAYVKNFGEEKIDIEKVDDDIDGLTASIQPGKNDHEFYLVIDIPTDAPKGPFRGAVVLHTSSAKLPTITVPVTGTVK